MLAPLKKENPLLAYELVSYNNGEIRYNFKLNKTKLLIGSFEYADVCIEDPSISNYHAIIFIEPEGIRIVDLESENGISLLGTKQKEVYINSEDEFKIGNVSFFLKESVEQTKVINLDEGKVEIIKALPDESFNANLPPIEGLTLIDGEYCDITFDEETFKPLDHNPLPEMGIEKDSYIEFDDEKKEVFDITKDTAEKSLEVSVLSNGQIISIDFLSLKKDITYYASSYKETNRTIVVPTFEGEKKAPFVSVTAGKAIFHEMSEHTFHILGKFDQQVPLEEASKYLEDNDSICFTRGGVQIMIRLSNQPPTIKAPPFFGRDLQFRKQSAKYFSGVMSVFLLLLLVDTTIEEPKKKIAVIFKKAYKSQKKKIAAKNSNVDKANGSRQVESKTEKKASAKPKSDSKKKKVAKKTKSKPQKTKSVNKKVSKVKKKTYKFNFKNSASSFLSSNNIKAGKVSDSTSKSSVRLASKSSLNSKNGLSDRSKLNIGTMGSDFSGSMNASTGAKGLSSKNGTDTTYMEPKTVVLGSMDPELLRKILREYLPQFRHCYQQELQYNDDKIKGVVDLNFQIGPDGKVVKSNIKAKDSRFSKRGISCMASVLKVIDFPKPKGGGVVDVKQPLNFFSEQNKI